jgi:hypothetical protein
MVEIILIGTAILFTVGIGILIITSIGDKKY